MLVCTTVADAGPRGAGGDEPGRPGFVLDIDFTVSPGLPSETRGMLVAEAERIWRREGVHLRFLLRPSNEQSPASLPLHVIVIARPQASYADNQWVVGELVTLTGERAIAIASIDGARRVLDEVQRFRTGGTSGDDHHLGLVLGRAVAHEIGHYLLATGSHSMRGLMRAGFDAREFSDRRAATTFLLDEDASRWLRQRVSGDLMRTRLAMAPLTAEPRLSVRPAEGFTYTPQTRSTP